MKRLAASWACQATVRLGQPEQEARVVFTTTIDDLSHLVMRPGMAVCIDECPISDREAIQYCSEGMCKKVLFDPGSPRSVRARGRNAQLAANTARLLPSSASSLQDWGGSRVKFTQPLQQNLIWIQTSRELVQPGWSTQPDFVAGEE